VGGCAGALLLAGVLSLSAARGLTVRHLLMLLSWCCTLLVVQQHAACAWLLRAVRVCGTAQRGWEREKEVSVGAAVQERDCTGDLYTSVVVSPGECGLHGAIGG
jgi:hypothetical protein